MLALTLALCVTAQAPAPQGRPDMGATITKASELILDFEEQKGLDMLTALTTQKDLHPVELAQIQMWRGVALVGVQKEAEAKEAFAVALGCQAGLVLPDSVPPRAGAVFAKVSAVVCPVEGESESIEVDEPAPEAVKKDTPAAADVPDAPGADKKGKDGKETKDGKSEGGGGGGPPKLTIAGVGMVVVALGVGVLALVGTAGGAGLLGGAFAVRSMAISAEKAADARQNASAALGMIVAGGVMAPVGAVLGLLGLVGFLGGGILAGVGFATRSE